jgi:hypothetical protein
MHVFMNARLKLCTHTCIHVRACVYVLYVRAHTSSFARTHLRNLLPAVGVPATVGSKHINRHDAMLPNGRFKTQRSVGIDGWRRHEQRRITRNAHGEGHVLHGAFIRGPGADVLNETVKDLAGNAWVGFMWRVRACLGVLYALFLSCVRDVEWLRLWAQTAGEKAGRRREEQMANAHS